jgi:hypothetical protein
MPQLLMLAAIGAGVYLGAKWLGRKADEIMQQGRRRTEAEQRTASDRAGDARRPPAGDIPTLVQDPETGVYQIDGRKR